MDTLLNSDIIFLLCDKLSPLDFWNLSKIEKVETKMLQMMERRTQKEIITRLEKYLKSFDRAKQLLKLLDETGSLISGSFITQCLMGVNWTEEKQEGYPDILYSKDNLPQYQSSSDVDIFFPIEHLKKFEEFFQLAYENANYTDIDSRISYSYKDDMFNLISFECNRIPWSISYDKRDPRENYDTNIITCVQDAIDLDICKNVYFQGKVILIRENIMDDLFTKTTNFGVGHKTGYPMSRLTKYIKRGFTFREIDVESLQKLLQNSKTKRYHDTSFRNIFNQCRMEKFLDTRFVFPPSEIILTAFKHVKEIGIGLDIAPIPPPTIEYLEVYRYLIENKVPFSHILDYCLDRCLCVEVLSLVVSSPSFPKDQLDFVLGFVRHHRRQDLMKIVTDLQNL